MDPGKEINLVLESVIRKLTDLRTDGQTSFKYARTHLKARQRLEYANLQSMVRSCCVLTEITQIKWHSSVIIVERILMNA